MPDLPKVFVLGFSKTATTSLHRFFRDNGYRSVHWDLPDGRFLAGVVVTNVLSNRPILASIDDYDVYSEFSYADGLLYLEANYFFRDLYAAYPDAYFLLNTRETEGWIASRKRHFGRNRKGRGYLAERIAQAYAASMPETEEIWRRYHPVFHQQVRDFFATQEGARFLEFNIDQDGPETLIDWLRPHYDLDLATWAPANVTTEQEAILKQRRNPIRRLLAKLTPDRRP